MSGPTHGPGRTDDVTVTSAGGYSVTVDADRLAQAAQHVHLDGEGTRDLRRQLTAALVPGTAFGRVPGGREAAGRLTAAVDDHDAAITGMGVSLADLAARLQAASDLAHELDPVTRKLSQIDRY